MCRECETALSVEIYTGKQGELIINWPDLFRAVEMVAAAKGYDRDFLKKFVSFGEWEAYGIPETGEIVLYNVHREIFFEQGRELPRFSSMGLDTMASIDMCGDDDEECRTCPFFTTCSEYTF
jgi:hypothetical protein